MTAYAGFARFYDRIMGDRTDEVVRILSFVARLRPQARTLLELGCGTGAILSGLTPRMTVTGIDRSPEMLAIAAEKLPDATLVQADITAFRLPAKFDVVICVFDTLNHLADFAGWLALFDRVYEHLADGGLFIFDVNTTGRLARLDGAPPYLDQFDGNLVLMTVRGDGPGLSMWETRIFEPMGEDVYRLHHERIHELGVPLADIQAALAARFELAEQQSLDGTPVGDQSDRAFFAYRRRP